MNPADIRRHLLLGLALGAALFGLGPIAPARAADPPKLAGTWTWKWKDAQGETHRHILEVEGEGDKMIARERFDDEAAVKATKVKLEGRKLTLVVERKDRRSEYIGTIADNNETINGEVTVANNGQPDAEFGWTATREAGKK